MKQAQQYAQGLITAVARGTSPKVAATRVRDMLAQRGISALLPHIVRALRQLEARAAQSYPEIRVAQRVDAQTALGEAALHLAADGVTESDVRVTEDSTIIGGWIYRNGSTYVDTSHKKQLTALYQRITQ